ncbi:hypothetical protein [Clostridium cylindrosporum]|uniref:Thymidine kinase n=1 Tax=Clostridium cylindrosporum DSM 605 TaxID=1121307 RepID=A0A0J8D9A2_CLOCY|nr:hypothetical protein [Clostridium cylindrosporum]KMT20863.1 thymidine kinase [Clostridium cylindrosporum DSM 605]
MVKSNSNLDFGKTKKVIDLANELLKSSKGDIIYISNSLEPKEYLKDAIKFLDLSEIEIINSSILKAIIEQLVIENKAVEIILIDNISNIIGEDEISDFLKEVDVLSSKNSVKILFGLDRENKDYVDSLDIEKID